MDTLPVEKVRRMENEATTRPLPGTVVEIPFLLEAGLLTVLEASAFEQGLTTGALVRRLVRDFLHQSAPG
jgi:hypothetical protein